MAEIRNEIFHGIHYEIYNESMERIENPNLTLGWLESSARTEHHEAVEGVEEVWHYETIREYPGGGRDVQRVVDVPGVQAREAWEEEIPILIYHPYTPEQLEKIEADRSRPSASARIAALEEELAAAKILLGVDA